ncbi:MAG: flagellar export chaperone FlgN [Candidatus Krumholzibacteriia bacterium]
MALPLMWSAEQAASPAPALEELLQLYAGERRLYGEILTLSRRQGELLRGGARIGELRALLTAKRDRLDAIAGLEREHAPARAGWARQRAGNAGAARLHAALREVAALIEEILEIEESNDRLLLAETGVAP